MANINIEKDSKLIKVLASQVSYKPVADSDARQVAELTNELVKENTDANRKQLAQAVGYTLQELQSHDLDFLSRVADIKNVGYNDKALFNIRTNGIKAYIQAKGSTTARSYIADRQVTVATEEISARPAINIVDMRAGRINMADLIREANQVMTNKKLVKIESVLHNAIDDYSSPFYATGTGIVKASLDAQINYFRRLGPVTILGDQAAVSQLSTLTGFQMNAAPSANDAFRQFSPSILDEHNANGFIGRYNGCDVVVMQNGYEAGSTSPILSASWLYIIPGGLSGDARNLKVVNEGGINTFESQNIDDMVWEIRIDEWFGAAFVSGKIPTMGAYLIG